MEQLKRYGMVMLSAILLATSVFLFTSGKNDTSASAEGGALSYSAEWDATELLVADINYVNSSSNQSLRRDVPFGIAAWKVVGREIGNGGTILYEEKWEVPAIPSIRYRLDGQDCPNFDNSLNGLRNDNGFKPAGAFNSYEWLLGIAGARVGNSNLCGEIRKVKKLNNGSWDYINQPERIGNDAKTNAAGSAVFCFNHTDTNCWISSGSYGLIYSDKMSIDASGVRAILIMMPLKWTVTGKIY